MCKVLCDLMLLNLRTNSARLIVGDIVVLLWMGKQTESFSNELHFLTIYFKMNTLKGCILCYMN